MLNNNEKFYYDIIVNSCPQATNIRHPDIKGAVCPVFLADTREGTKVFRFNEASVAFRNRSIGNLLVDNGILTPVITTHGYRSTWYEKYNYCPDKTLYEHLTAKEFDDKQIESVYKQVLIQMAEMAKIKPISFSHNNLMNYQEVFVASMKQRLHPALVEFYGYFVRVLAGGDAPKLVHNDLNQKNILTTEDGTLTRILDLDAVALANESFAVMMALRYYPLNNHHEMIEFYQDITGHKLNEKAIMMGIQFLNTIRSTRHRFDRLFLHSPQR